MVVEEIRAVGPGVDPTTAASFLVYQKPSLEEGPQAEVQEAEVELQAQKLEDVVEEVVEAEA